MATENQAQKAVAALLKYVESKENEATSRLLLNEKCPIQMQIVLKKVPQVKNKLLKFDIPHPLYTDETSICLIVPDEGHARNDDHELFSSKFKAKLHDKGITHISEVIPFKQLTTEFKTYESRRKLCNMFDIFLADGKLMSLLPHRLGKAFFKKKKMPIQVNLDARDLKKEIYKVLDRTYCTMSGSGPSCTFVVAHTGLTEMEITKNILSCMDKLDAVLPGGRANVRGLYLKTATSPALPYYYSFGSKQDVDLPKPEVTLFEDLLEDVTTVTSGKVLIRPDGYIKVIGPEEEEKLIAARATAGNETVKEGDDVMLLPDVEVKQELDDTLEYDYTATENGKRDSGKCVKKLTNTLTEGEDAMMADDTNRRKGVSKRKRETSEKGTSLKTGSQSEQNGLKKKAKKRKSTNGEQEVVTRTEINEAVDTDGIKEHRKTRKAEKLLTVHKEMGKNFAKKKVKEIPQNLQKTPDKRVLNNKNKNISSAKKPVKVKNSLSKKKRKSY